MNEWVSTGAYGIVDNTRMVLLLQDKNDRLAGGLNFIAN